MLRKKGTQSFEGSSARGFEGTHGTRPRGLRCKYYTQGHKHGSTHKGLFNGFHFFTPILYIERGVFLHKHTVSDAELGAEKKSMRFLTQKARIVFGGFAKSLYLCTRFKNKDIKINPK